MDGESECLIVRPLHKVLNFWEKFSNKIHSMEIQRLQFNEMVKFYEIYIEKFVIFSRFICILNDSNRLIGYQMINVLC